MDLAAVGAASIDMHLASVQNGVSMKMLKGAMETQEAAAMQMVESLQVANQPPQPSFGHILDIRV